VDFYLFLCYNFRYVFKAGSDQPYLSFLEEKMKKLLVFLFCTLFLFITACAIPQEPFSDEETSGQIQMADPFTEYATVDEARAAIGFDFKVPPDSISGYTRETISVMSSGELQYAQLLYTEGDFNFIYRTAIAPAQLNDDDRVFPDHYSADIDGIPVAICGSGGRVSSASWEADGYAYCIIFSGPSLSAETFRDIITAIS